MSDPLPNDDFDLLGEFAEEAPKVEESERRFDVLASIPRVLARQRAELVKLYYDLRGIESMDYNLLSSPIDIYTLAKEAQQDNNIAVRNITTMENLNGVSFLVFPPSDRKIKENISGKDSVALLVLEKDFDECINFINFMKVYRSSDWIPPEEWVVYKVL